MCFPKRKNNHFNIFYKINPFFFRYRANNCMRKLTVLMRTCESEIGKRNEQMKILLEAYDKYQTHNQTLCNILQAMKSTRDELSKCSECRWMMCQVTRGVSRPICLHLTRNDCHTFDEYIHIIIIFLYLNENGCFYPIKNTGTYTVTYW